MAIENIERIGGDCIMIILKMEIHIGEIWKFNYTEDLVDHSVERLASRRRVFYCLNLSLSKWSF